MFRTDLAGIATRSLVMRIRDTRHSNFAFALVRQTPNKDSKIWLVNNPEMLSGIDGRHVRVKAFADVAPQPNSNFVG
jgi:hypothetical protein